MVLLSYNIYPICLPPVGATFLGKTATVMGWGRTHSERFPSKVMEANLTIWNGEICKKIYSRKFGINAITDKNICAKGSRGVDACRGDSGGPLICLNDLDMRYELCGIVSWGDGDCRSVRPGVYTRTSKYLDWIFDTIPTLYPCDDGLECLKASECKDIEWRKSVANLTSSVVAKEALEQELESLRCHDISVDDIFADDFSGGEDRYCCKRNMRIEPQCNTGSITSDGYGAYNRVENSNLSAHTSPHTHTIQCS